VDQICESHRGIFRDAFIGRYSVMVLGSEGCELRWLVDLGDPDEVSFSEIETGPPRSKFGPGGFVFANRGMVSFEDEYMVVLPKGILGASSLEGGGIAAFDNDGHLHIWPAGTLSF